MMSLTPGWKFFRICCIIYMVLVALQLMLGVSGLFYRKKIIFPLTETLAYGLIFIFVYMGLSMLNYNYPDTSLTPKQRRNFSWLFLINFLLIAYLFGQLLAEIRWIAPNISVILGNFSNFLTLISMAVVDLLIFVLHIIFLLGMYRLRRLIHENTMNSYYSQFEEEKK